MSKLVLGNIYKVQTTKGNGYFQVVHSSKLEGESIKVFYELFKEDPSLEELVLSEYYIIGFPLKHALKRKDIVEYVGHIELPRDFRLPLYMRSRHIIPGKINGWSIVNRASLKLDYVETLSDEQMKLFPDGIINDTYLKERFEEGWRLENWK